MINSIFSQIMENQIPYVAFLFRSDWNQVKFQVTTSVKQIESMFNIYNAEINKIVLFIEIENYL